MPTRTDPSVSPGLRTHSCSVVYFRSSGYTGAPHVPKTVTSNLSGLFGAVHPRRAIPPGRPRGSFWLGELRTVGRVDRLDVDLLQLVDLDVGAVVAQLCGRSLVEHQRLVEGVRVADHVDDVRRRERGPVDGEAAHLVLQGALRDDPYLTVELHRLGAGRAQLFHGVEDRVDVDRPGLLGDRDANAGSGDRDQAGEDVEGVGLLLRLGQGRRLTPRVRLQLTLGLLEAADLGTGMLGGAGQPGQHVVQVLLAQCGVSVVHVVGAHLDDRGEPYGGQQRRDHELTR